MIVLGPYDIEGPLGHRNFIPSCGRKADIPGRIVRLQLCDRAVQHISYGLPALHHKLDIGIIFMIFQLTRLWREGLRLKECGVDLVAVNVYALSGEKDRGVHLFEPFQRLAETGPKTIVDGSVGQLIHYHSNHL